MDVTEYSRQATRTQKYQCLLRDLEKAQRAIEDLKFPNGTLRLEIGGGRSTFERFEQLDWIRPRLIDAFNSEVNRLQQEIAAI